MHYLIDGHNLIPALGLSLADPEDENALLERLRQFARGKKACLTVYFDRAPQAQTINLGAVRAIFVPAPQIADEAIMQALARAGAKARNLSVVSSDRQVQAAARAKAATVLSSQSFASLINQAGKAASPSEPAYPSPEEVSEWQALFSSGKKDQR